MPQDRFDEIVGRLGQDPAARRRVLLALALGLIGGTRLVSMPAAAVTTSAKCKTLCGRGCCPRRAPACCKKYNFCCPKGTRFCDRNGCWA
ncbi:MAG: hypothetical protein ACKOWF_06675 [Chloroflexota bacterium]